MALAPWEGGRTVTPWCTLCACWATDGHLSGKGHAKWALHEGVHIHSGQMPYIAGLNGDTNVSTGSLARVCAATPPGTYFMIDGMWRLPRGGPPPPPAARP